MGSVISFFSTKEYLYSYIESNQNNKVVQIIKQYPQLLNAQITDDSKCTPLSRAVWRNNYQLVEILLGMGADVNLFADKHTPLIIASFRNHLRIVKLLLNCKCDPTIKTQQNLNCLDYAILYGNYEVAKYLIQQQKMKIQFTYKDYQIIAQRKKMFYVNYQLLYQYLVNQYNQIILPDFYAIPPKSKLIDPVLDPRQTWGNFIRRVSQFGPPPLVQRNQLPSQLQPQNRILGKIHFFIQKLKGGSNLSLQPKQEPQIQSDRKSISNQI